jgi:2-polyprenyl-6-hydroxyphenyl methylase/3-demethylubiquinone-9 3-methyltransferase
VAQLHLLESARQVTYRKIEVEALAREQPARYDVVTCMEVLEHVPDPGSQVAACARLLKPGGHAFFATINRNLKAFVFAIVGAEYVLRCAEVNPRIRKADLPRSYPRTAGGQAEVSQLSGMS